MIAGRRRLGNTRESNAVLDVFAARLRDEMNSMSVVAITWGCSLLVLCVPESSAYILGDIFPTNPAIPPIHHHLSRLLLDHHYTDHSTVRPGQTNKHTCVGSLEPPTVPRGGFF